MGVDDNRGQTQAPTSLAHSPETWLENREVAHEALKEYLRSRDKPIPKGTQGIYEHVAEVLPREQYADLERQFRFGGRQSLNFWVITGVSNKIDKLEESVEEEFPSAEEVQDQKGEPYFVETRRFGGRLYVNCGQLVSQRTTDPETGYPNRHLVPDDCVAVVNESSDLVHVRTAKVPIARKICKSLASAVDINTGSSDIFYKPEFDTSFVDQLSDYIEKYVNMTVRVETASDRTAGSVKFSSRKNSSGEYQDLRDDQAVQEELKEGSIKRGYVKLSESDFAFEMNRKQSKIWFRSYEREERIAELVNLIDDVLRKGGGYPQTKLQGFRNIPEGDSSN